MSATSATAGLLSSSLQGRDRACIRKTNPEYKIIMQTIDSFFLSQRERDARYE